MSPFPGTFGFWNAAARQRQANLSMHQSSSAGGQDHPVDVFCSNSGCWHYVSCQKRPREGSTPKPIIVVATIWARCGVVLASSLQLPGASLLCRLGGFVLVGIVAVLSQLHNGSNQQGEQNSLSRLTRVLCCGQLGMWIRQYGTNARPTQAARPLAHNILVTQSSKLMFEFLFAWSLLLASAVLSRRARRSVIDVVAYRSALVFARKSCRRSPMWFLTSSLGRSPTKSSRDPSTEGSDACFAAFMRTPADPKGFFHISTLVPSCPARSGAAPGGCPRAFRKSLLAWAAASALPGSLLVSRSSFCSGRPPSLHRARSKALSTFGPSSPGQFTPRSNPNFSSSLRSSQPG